MRYWLPRILTLTLLPLVLFVACTQASGARQDSRGPLVLKVQRANVPAEPAEANEHAATIHPGAPENPVEIAPEARHTVPGTPTDAPSGDPGAGEGDLTFAVVSDLNGSYGRVDYAEEVYKSVHWLIDAQKPDLVISTGDMVAGQRRGLDYRAMWRGFHAAVTDPLSAAGIPLAVTPGNHDASAGAAYLDERITFVEQWRRRRPDVEFVDDRFYPLHYAFKMKSVLFVSLDATMVGPLDPAQRRWLREVLSQNTDARAKVVFGHIPLYPVTQGRETEILNDPALEAMLNEFGVDLMLSGHHHGYYPGRRGDLRLVTMACLGSGPRKLVGTDTVSPKSLVIVRVTPDGEVTLDGFGAMDHQKIDRETLPEHLNDGPQRIWRDDLGPEAPAS